MKTSNGIICLAAALCIITWCAVSAGAQTPPQSNRAESTAAESLSTPNQPAPAPIESIAVIVVPDTSGSVRRLLSEIKSRSKEIVAVAPAGAHIGVVGINWEASKGLFVDPSAANEFIDSLTTGGRYTDLGRGNDAAMSLLQEAGAGRAVVVFLTDGELEVPAEFRNRETFIEMLRREYSARPDVRVFVLNVRRSPLAGSDTLPRNVTVIPLADWHVARNIIAENLAPQIRAQLAQPQPTTTVAPEAAGPQSSPNRKRTMIYAAIGLIAVGTLLFLFLRLRHRSAGAGPKTDELENILREEDLMSVAESNDKSEPVLILSAALGNEGNKFPSQRAVLHAGERLTIGKSRHLSGLALPELHQSQTLEIAFDGESVEAFRLRSAAGETLDQVRLDGENAPVHFTPCAGERIGVGVYEVELLLADETALLLYDTTQRTGAIIVDASPESAAQRVRGGRLRRSGT